MVKTQLPYRINDEIRGKKSRIGGGRVGGEGREGLM